MAILAWVCAACVIFNRGTAAIVDNGPGCSEASIKITSPEECHTAAAYLGFTGNLHVGNWDHAPPGCHVGHPTDDWSHVYFNRIETGRLGRPMYKSICYKNDAPVSMSEAIFLRLPLDEFVNDSMIHKKLSVNTNTELLLAINGGWSRFGRCSKPCGGTRTRRCNNPAPAFGGKQCQGSKHYKCSTISCDAEVIFIAGGDGSDSLTEVLDLTGNCSKRTYLLDDYRWWHTSHLLNNQIILCGGFHTKTSCVSSSTPALGGWKHYTSLPDKRFSHSGAVLNGTIYLLGNYPRGDTMDVGTRNFTTEKLPHDVGIGSCTAVLDDDRFILTGGDDSGERGEKVSLYEKSSGTWTRLPDMPQGGRFGPGRYYHACTIAQMDGDPVLVVAGGDSSSGPLRSASILNLNTNRWTRAADMSVTRRGARLVTLAGMVFILGGEHKIAVGKYATCDCVEELDLATLKWKVIEQKMTTPREFFSALVVPRELVCH